MRSQPGYPLPSGELGDDDIVCQLVFLPNRPEYWQALVGALGYMATWRAWERDDDKRGKDAASNWREAFELTMECWRMACLDELQDNVAEILAIMQLGNSCCDNQDITDGDRYTDRVEDGEGDVPQPIIDAGYADDAADWDGFDDYKCMIAHVTINQMEARLREISEIVDSAGPYLAVAAALSAIMGVIVATGGLAIVFGILAGIGTVSALYYALIEFGPVADLADEVATNHDELACAIYFADGDVGALVALNDKIDELFSASEALILKNLNNGPTLKMLYAGRYDQQDIAEILEAAGYELGDFSCLACTQEGEFMEYFDFETGDFQGWANSGGYIMADAGRPGATGYCYRGDFGASDFLHASSSTVARFAGGDPAAGDVIQIHSIHFWYRFTGGETNQISLKCAHDGGTFEDIIDYVDDTWRFYEKLFDPALESTAILAYIIAIKTHFGGAHVMLIDDITLDFDYTPV